MGRKYDIYDFPKSPWGKITKRKERSYRVIRFMCDALIIISVVVVMSCSFAGLVVHGDNCLCNACEDQFNEEHNLDVIEGEQE